MNSLPLVGLDQVQITPEQYQLIQEAIITAARKPLVGRQVMPIRELNDYGITEIKYWTQTDMNAAAIGMAALQGNADVVGLAPGTLGIPVLWKDFQIFARDLASSQRLGIPLDTSFASDAGRRVGELEETLIWEGVQGFVGFMGSSGHGTEASAGAWSTAANAYKDIMDTVADLETAGYSGRPTLIVTPAQKADMRLHIGTTSDTVLEKAQELCDVVTCHFFADNASALMVMPDPENFQLDIAQNLVTHPVMLPSQDLWCRVYEALIPKFKRANSIVEITGITV